MNKVIAFGFRMEEQVGQSESETCNGAASEGRPLRGKNLTGRGVVGEVELGGEVALRGREDAVGSSNQNVEGWGRSMS